MGRQLARRLKRLIDTQTDSDAERAALIGRMGRAGGIDSGTVNQILNTSIDCPPLARLSGFARVLDVSAQSLRGIAEDDGCNYSD